jgi:hypothetical protein
MEGFDGRLEVSNSSLAQDESQIKLFGYCSPVIPAFAGMTAVSCGWIPAFAGMMCEQLRFS